MSWMRTVTVGAVLAFLAAAVPAFAQPALEAQRFIATTPFVNAPVEMADGEGMAYVPVNDTLWLGDDDLDRIYEVDKQSGHLLSVITRSDLANAVRLGGTAFAGSDRAADIKSLAYDPVGDALFVFSGWARPPTAFRLVRDNAAEKFRVETFQPLPASSSFVGAAFHPGQGLYVSDLGVVKPYDYVRNSLGAAVPIDSRVSGAIRGMGFSADGRDLWVVTVQEKVYRIDWVTKQVVEGYEFDLVGQGINDGVAVEFVDGQLYVLDGYNLPDGDPRRLAVTVFNIVGVSNPTLEAPSDLMATALSSGEIALAWVDNSGDEDGFKIERCPSAGCVNFAPIAIVGPDVTGYADAGLTASTTYTYRVRAFSGSGDSADSNTASATTPGLLPAAPGTLAATAISSSEITLGWIDNSGNEDGFRIERCRSAGCTDFGEIATVASNLTTYTDSGLAASTTYVYRVRATNSAGSSDYSNTASATTASATPPSTLTFAPSHDATIKFESPRTNYGSYPALEAYGSPREQFLLKFSVSGTGSRRITSAKLRLYNINGSETGGEFFVGEHNDWTEATVTWDTAPRAVGTAVASLASVRPGNWYEVDLTGVIASAGTYSFRVTSSSGNGTGYRSKEADVTLRPHLVVTVASEEAPPPPPGPLTVDAGSDQVGSEGVTFNFSGATTGGTPPYTYTWSLGDGATKAGSSVTHSYADNGSYVATLTVADAAGQTVQDTVQVAVANGAPTASAGGPYSGAVGVGVTFQGSGTDPSPADTAAGLTFAWDFGDGSTGTGASATHGYAAPGTYSVRLVVTDKDGGSGSATATVTVTAAALTVDAGPDQFGSEGVTFNFSGATTGGTPPYTYTWSLGDGATKAGSSVTHSYADNGSYAATLTVADAAGQTAQDTVQVAVANGAPTASAGGPYTGAVGVGVTLQGSGTDPSPADMAAGLTFAWDFGDGSTGTGASATHGYAAPGTYSVRLVVTDKDGGSGSATATVTIGGRIIQVPGDAASVQGGIDLAADGDTVLVAPGTYRENLMLAKTITLASHFHTTGDTSDIGQTILDGGGGPSVISVASSVGPDTTIVGFTIRGAGDGVVTVGGAFNLLNNVITGNNDGVDCESCRLVARGNVVEGNGDDGFDVDEASAVTIEDNIIRHNGDDGIEVRLHSYAGPTLTIIIRNNVIAENGSDGIQLIDHPGDSFRVFSIEKNLIQGNQKAGLGMMADGNTREDFSGAPIPDPIFLTNNTFVGNDHGVTGGVNVTALNNIFAGSIGIAVKNVGCSTVSCSTVSYSLFWTNGLDWEAANVDLATSQVADPLFDSTYRLLPGSPAIDAGVNVGLPFTGPAPDLGAYETAGPTTVRFAVIGDYGKDNPDEGRVADLVKSWNPDFIITTGDNNYPDGEASTIDQNIGKYYAAFIGNYVGAYGPGSSTNRFWPSLGNHDWNTPGATPYRDYFTLPNNERYYSVDLGLVRLYAVDSDEREPDGTSAASIQASWLRVALAASTSCFNVVYFHHPPYSSGRHGSTEDMRWPFPSWGADVVLAGHDHVYERILDTNGFPYFVNGVGGNLIVTFDNIGTLPPEVTSVVRYNADFGAMLVTATPTGITYEFYNASGALIDSYSRAKSCQVTARSPAPPTNLPATAVAGSRSNLTWRDHSDNEINFAIEPCPDAGCSRSGELAAGHADTGLTGSPPYVDAWSFGDLAALSGSNVSHGYGDNVTYVVALTVFDAAGQPVQDLVQVAVTTEAPTAGKRGPYASTAGVGVAFPGSATDPGSADMAAGLSFAWAFADDSTGSGALATHAYAIFAGSSGRPASGGRSTSRRQCWRWPGRSCRSRLTPPAATASASLRESVHSTSRSWS